MRHFSKSKLIAFRQCPKRFWLEIHRPELREDSADTRARFQTGYQVGAIAQRLYDPEGNGALIDVNAEGFDAAFARTAELIADSRLPIFEAGFKAHGALAFADVMLPEFDNGQLVWRMVEVKSSTSVKDYHRDDVAVQAFVAESAGVKLKSVALAHIDSSWVYPGDQDYRGLLTEKDLTEEAFARTEEVKGWIAEAQRIADQPSAPDIAVGAHCYQPFECGFCSHCNRGVVQPEYPIHWLPRISAAQREQLAEQGVNDLRGVPEALLSDKQLRVKEHTLAKTVFFDAEGAASDLAPHGFPSYFLDFESIQFGIPIWKGTRPYQQMPFQFSLHTLAESGALSHTAFLDLSGDDPSAAFTRALVAACGGSGPVFVYNAAFETRRIHELAERYPDFAEPLLGIQARVVDLLPIARNRYYHHSQQGSWSIKAVLPAAAPELSYNALDGVQDGGAAMEAYHEAIQRDTTAERKREIEQQLLAYCRLDTFAIVRLWLFFSGRSETTLQAADEPRSSPLPMNPPETATAEARTRNEEPSTFESIFFPNGEALAVRVPDYQRAFAWNVEQIDLFIGDLEEYAIKAGYYFGHFIVEAKSEGPWEVVDGQQRLTTFVLFLMVCRVLAPAESHAPAFGLADKFATVSYDGEALKTIAGNLKGYLDASDSFDAKNPPADEQIAKDLGLSLGRFTRSQRRMVFALLRFRQAFRTQELKPEKITSYIGVVMKSLCSHHLTRDKSVAVSIFEMHNSRGIPLSTLEIVKAKLMKFVYDHAGAERDSKVGQIQKEFGEIYGMEEQLATRSFRGKMTMEHLLRLHFRAVDDGSKKTAEDFDSPADNATADDLLAYLETMLRFTDRNKTTGKDRQSGVKYAMNLAKEFKKSVLIVSRTLPEWDDEDQLVGDVLILEPDLSCQFFLIICRLMESSSDKADGRIGSGSLSQWEKLLFTRDFHGAYHNLKRGRDNFPALFQECRAERENIEQVIQRYLANGFRAGRTTGLPSLVLKYLRDHKERILSDAFGWWWLPKLKYAIYKYEVREVATIRKVMKGTLSVEHILPQEWKWAWVEEEDVPPKALSESERGPAREAVQKEIGSYINGLGNLLLLTPGENTAQGNNHPAEKRYERYRAGGSYKEHDLNREKWRSSKEWPNLIRARGEEIFQFMLGTLVDGSDPAGKADLLS